jgi:hypothetical protein
MNWLFLATPDQNHPSMQEARPGDLARQLAEPILIFVAVLDGTGLWWILP